MANSKENKDNKPWTRKELSLRIGFGELAAAVIEQWHKDGEPASDREAMEYWFNIKQMLDARKASVAEK